MGDTLLAVKKERLTFIDVMRGIAVIWMIETHVVDVILYKAHKQGWFYEMLNISNGFVAVAFIFCAGAGFWLAAQKKADDYKHFRQPLWVYVRRLLFILVIAYCLHFPSASIEKLFNISDAKWLVFFESDVLQCIVYTSFIALAALMLTPRLKLIPWIFGALALSVFMFSPWVWAWDALAALPNFFGALVSEPPISKFPLTPWSGYFFGGVAVTAYFMSSENKKKVAWIYFISGFAIAALFMYNKWWFDSYPYVEAWWKGSPGLSFFRFFGTVSVFGFLYLIEGYYKETRIGNALKISGQESLFLYVSHLLIVYGSAVNFGVRYLMGARLDYFKTFLIFAAITLFCYIFAYIWHELKARDMKKARWVMIATFALLFIISLLNPA
jgi:uncharacterized membrane protein